MGTVIKAKKIFEVVTWLDKIRPLPLETKEQFGQLICLLCSRIDLKVCPNCADRAAMGQHSGT